MRIEVIARGRMLERAKLKLTQKTLKVGTKLEYAYQLPLRKWWIYEIPWAFTKLVF